MVVNGLFRYLEEIRNLDGGSTMSLRCVVTPKHPAQRSPETMSGSIDRLMILPLCNAPFLNAWRSSDKYVMRLVKNSKTAYRS